MHILGAGVAYPDGRIDNDLLVELGVAESSDRVLDLYGISERRTTLSTDYILETKNSNPIEGKSSATCTPTDLGYKAAISAILSAGITPDDIGLVLGECATPDETCPGESQRVAKHLGIKVPSFDVISSLGCIPMHLDALAKRAVIPRYVLCLSTNTPTQFIDYSGGEAPLIFGDAAGAVVVSTEAKGKLEVICSTVKSANSTEFPVEIDLLKHLVIRNSPEKILEELSSKSYSELSKMGDIDLSNSKLICTQYGAPIFRSIQEKLKVAPEVFLNNFASVGYSLGSSFVSALADSWETLQSGEDLLLFGAGLDLNYGAVLFRVRD